MCKYLDALEASCKNNDGFLPFLSRKNMHSTEEQVKSCSKLPPSFFTEAKLMIRKYFTQWTSDDDIQLFLGGEKSVSIAFLRWLLGKTIIEHNVAHDFNRKIIITPSFINFIAENSRKYCIKSQPFFIQFQSEIAKMSDDARWQSEPDLIYLKDFIAIVRIPLFAHAQSIEARSKI